MALDPARNLMVAWMSLALGAATGMVLGLWSFDGPFPAPGSLEAYDSLSRRFMRLGHIAFFGLGILNILLAHHLCGLRVSLESAGIGLAAMNFGNVFLPLTLFAAGVFEPLKYLTLPPAIAVTTALAIGAYATVLELRAGET